MKKLSRICRAASLVTGAVLILGPVAAAQATSVTFGPDSFTAAGNQDSSGTRANFDYTAPTTLGAGTWTLSNFSFQASQAGDAQPVIATVSGTAGSGSETYTLIAIGTDTTVTGSGFNSVSDTATFTVPLGGETVYAGFVNQNAQPVDWVGDNNVPNGPFNDAHFNPGYNISNESTPPAVVGDTFVESGGGGSSSSSSNGAYELGRVYQFSITVTNSVPEPASVVLFGLGAMGLFVAVRRRKS
jgi:hypothetical protein